MRIYTLRFLLSSFSLTYAESRGHKISLCVGAYWSLSERTLLLIIGFVVKVVNMGSEIYHDFYRLGSKFRTVEIQDE